MSRKLILFADREEATATLNTLNTEYISKNCYAYEEGLIVISSMGVHFAQHAVSSYAKEVDEVWNFGLAGALNDAFEIGALLEVKYVGKYIPSGPLDPDSTAIVEKTAPHIALEAGEVRLVTSDFPIHDDKHRASLAKAWDVVDMEGYGIAFAALQLGKKCRMWKIVSDFASPGGRNLIHTHKRELSEKIAEKLHARCAYS